MGHRVLGVTVSDDTVRIAVVETKLRGFELKAAWEIDRRAGGSGIPWTDSGGEDASGERPAPRPVAELLATHLAVPPGPGDEICMAFPGGRGFVRRLSFPFKENGRIAATLPFQMIGQVPIQPEDIHCAFERIVAGPQGADILAVAVPRVDFREFLDGARTDGLSPGHVSLDGACLLSLLPYVETPPEGGLQMLLWAEGPTIDFAVADGQKPVLVRSIALGGDVVCGTEVSPAALREVLLTAASVSETGGRVGVVRVAGPGAVSLVRPLGEALGIPCTLLDPATLPIPGAALVGRLSPSMTKAVSLALAAAAGGGPGSINLRVGDYGMEGAHGVLREHYRFFAWMLALFAVLGVGRAGARYVGLNAERDAVVRELVAFTKDTLGKERDDFDGVLKTMKGMIEEDVHIFPRWTAVDTLNRLSAAVVSMGAHAKGGADVDAEGGAGGASSKPGPDGLPGVVNAGAGAGAVAGAADKGTRPPPGPGEAYAVELESVRIDHSAASIRGEADSIETLDGLVARLKADPCLHEVVTESTERIQFERHQGWQRFSLRMSVDCVVKEAAKKPKATAAAKPVEK